MSRILNITNGDHAVDVMRAAHIEGDFLPWRDVLHEGPVPDLPLPALAEVRAEYIASMGWAYYPEVINSFRTRDFQLQRLSYYKQINLWFEGDLYDQLQLVQILNWLHHYQQKLPKVTLAFAPGYLSEYSAAELHQLQANSVPLMPQMLISANQVWQAFTGGKPELLVDCLTSDLSSLPQLHDALKRLLQEFPSQSTGLNLTQTTILQLVQQQSLDCKTAFSGYQQQEAYRFMTDLVFMARVKQLAQYGLITPADVDWSTELSLTTLGHDVLAGQQHLSKLVKFDFWLGGAHFNHEKWWQWHEQDQCLHICSA
ncbi:DUF1835 domain-containing protein [Motilimonas pumila]|uniref:DUF1835 domain-containing protein n=1 Tax=Motilimonas pumila TaxID=2303987 RepID=A0A418YIV6_9GAMM|nr:DUF1835 domain-containing protein [Motilimonas pumila]RJG50542.1 DUF1835 domain-containing protein [Motilimonas pumila]